jgi:hypothetical protein
MTILQTERLLLWPPDLERDLADVVAACSDPELPMHAADSRRRARRMTGGPAADFSGECDRRRRDPIPA